jgi:hypothetical protein
MGIDAIESSGGYVRKAEILSTKAIGGTAAFVWHGSPFWKTQMNPWDVWGS